MNILVLKSSGNKNGSSNMLADEFTRGARENGHNVVAYDIFRADIRPCLGCGRCGMNGPCVQKDDYENTVKDLIKGCDMLVFAMPVYYYNWPSKLKTVIDRFYSYTAELTSMKKKTALISAAWDDSDTVFAVVEAYYRQLCTYMNFQDQGTVLGRGCGTPDLTSKSRYIKDAYKLGRSILSAK